MNLSIDLVLYIIALIFFGLGAFGVDTKVNPIAAGLFCLTLSLLV